MMSGVSAVSPGAPDLTALFNNDEIVVVISSSHLSQRQYLSSVGRKPLQKYCRGARRELGLIRHACLASMGWVT
jgi:hypothetical protein